MEPLARNASHWVELRPRVLSGIVLIIVVAAAVVAGGMIFNGLVLLCALLMSKEWDRLTRTFGNKWRLAGYFYVILPCAALIWLRNAQFIPPSLTTEDLDYEQIYSHILTNRGIDGMYLSFYLIASVACTDIGAFFAGRHIGGPRLAPRISPNKTWAGLLGGMTAAASISCLFASFSTFPNSIMQALWMGFLIAIVSQCGDLFESWLKRKAGVKDSGSLIPGHGGILDRLDGYVFAAPLLVIMVLFFGGTRL